jgi:hypothetical protein
MKNSSRSRLVSVTAIAAIVQSVYAQQPPDVVKSDKQQNTAMGTGALISLTSDCGPNPPTCDYGNTASGYRALYSNLGGNQNTADGAQALYSNTTTGLPTTLEVGSGNANTAVGYQALYSNTNGFGNTAVGNQALYSNTTMAVGADQLAFGQYNSALGYDALYSNTIGQDNIAAGYYALYSNTTGSNNIVVGYQAGYNLTTGSNNIDIGSAGVAGESNVIRIGTKGTHKVAVIAGIDSSKITGSAVYVTATGRLGVLASSERFKTGIVPIGDDSEKLQRLRPVSFHLKADPKGAVQYGLIAEEVAKVYPELVVRDEKGRVDGVRYDELAPMLLNEVQQERQQIAAQAVDINDLKQQMQELKALHAQ